MSRSATPATRNEATRRLKPPKIGPLLQNLPYRHGHVAIALTAADGCRRLRTVADGCERKRNVERTHPQPPDPQSETGTLATHSGKSYYTWGTREIGLNMGLNLRTRCLKKPSDGTGAPSQRLTQRGVIPTFGGPPICVQICVQLVNITLTMATTDVYCRYSR